MFATCFACISTRQLLKVAPMKGCRGRAANNEIATVRGIVPCLAVAFLCCYRGEAAQYDRCNATTTDIGNGRCDEALNTPNCGWDGGDVSRP